MNINNKENDKVITINIGSKLFDTTLGTLKILEPNNIINRMVINDVESKIKMTLDKNGNIFIDRNPKLFNKLLNYLRTGISPKHFNNSLKEESLYYGSDKLISLIDQNI